MIFPIVISIIILIIFIFLCALSAWIASTIVHGRRQTLDEAWDWQQEHVDGTHIFTRDMLSDYTVMSAGGETVHVSFLPTKEKSDKYIILAHGYTDTRYGMMKYVPHYYALGFNCVLFDERGHGENAPAPCSYGVREKDYLIAVLEDTIRRYGDGIIIGLHGESLGGATVLTSLNDETVKQHISFVVDDCGFAEIIPVLKGGLRNSHLPAFMVYPASLAAKIMYGVSFTEARPIASVVDNHIPICCIHGADDDFILPEHSKRVYDATKGERELHLIEGASHAISAVVSPNEYRDILTRFLQKVMKATRD